MNPRYFLVPDELVACMAEIHSDLGYLLDYGPDILETMELLQGRISTLLGELGACESFLEGSNRREEIRP